jgi:hypothetical protein
MAGILLDYVAGDRRPKKTLAVGYYLVLTGAEEPTVFFFPDKESLVEAIRDNPSRLPQCFVFDFSAILKEAFDRVEAWENRRPYIPKVSESILAQAQREWIERHSGNLAAAIKRTARSK